MGKGGAEYTSLSGDTLYSTAKWAIFVINFLTALAGAALIGVGIYALLNPLGSAMVPMTLPIIAIVAGGLVILLSLLGFFSFWMQDKNMLWIYFALLALLVFVQLVVGVVALNTRGHTIDQLADRRWSYLYEHNPHYIRNIEEQYHCCGLNFVDDRAYPKVSDRLDKHRCSVNKDFGYNRACLGPVRGEWESRQTGFGIAVISLAALQLLALLPAYYLASRLPSAEERERDLLAEFRQRLLDTEGGNRSAEHGGGYGSTFDAGGAGPLRTDRERTASPVQHTVGRPAGSYPYQGSRPGSRAG
ncbi:Tetraspanin family-domain-containing protein [Powellomyces hirtus]|nr:Tetraspanin family-domain-containing protein [Powellomyces hirtus]